MLSKHLLLMTFAACLPLYAQFWTTRAPRLQWENKTIGESEANGLLANVCQGAIKATTTFGDEKGFGCDSTPTRDQGSKAMPSFRVDQFTSPKLPTAAPQQISFWGVSKVIYGHFLGASSNEAVVSGYAGESHADYMGGTLLLTSVGGEWKPIWYKSAVITRFCRKITARTGKDLLLCEEEDGGMGHSYHIVYLLDFVSPKPPFGASVFVADSYVDVCREQQVQSIDAITFGDTTQDALSIMTVFARHGRRPLSKQQTAACASGRLRSLPTVRNYRLDFRLQDSLVPAVGSARAAVLFSSP